MVAVAWAIVLAAITIGDVVLAAKYGLKYEGHEALDKSGAVVFVGLIVTSIVTLIRNP